MQGTCGCLDTEGAERAYATIASSVVAGIRSGLFSAARIYLHHTVSSDPDRSPVTALVLRFFLGQTHRLSGACDWALRLPADSGTLLAAAIEASAQDIGRAFSHLEF